jgi:Zn finger protein HypA/HybF involved in hydrogenase expression
MEEQKMNESQVKKEVKLATFKLWNEVLTSSAGIVLGIAILMSLSLWQESGGGKSGFQGICTGVLFFVGLGLVFGGGGNIWNIIKLKTTSHHSPPIRNVTCSNCNYEAQVNVRQFSFFCEWCNTQQNWLPYGKDFSINPEESRYRNALAEGCKCSKCQRMNSMINRSFQFTCPKCKSEVHLDQIPS